MGKPVMLPNIIYLMYSSDQKGLFETIYKGDHQRFGLVIFDKECREKFYNHIEVIKIDKQKPEDMAANLMDLFFINKSTFIEITLPLLGLFLDEERMINRYENLIFRSGIGEEKDEGRAYLLKTKNFLRDLKNMVKHHTTLIDKQNPSMN